MSEFVIGYTRPVRRHVLRFMLYLLTSVLLIPLSSRGQNIDDAVLIYDFNQHEIREKNNKTNTRASAVMLINDRFGNAQSALRFAGTNQSYLNLGVSRLLKSPNMSVSFWINIGYKVTAGKGYDVIPILGSYNGPGFDFVNAFCLGYDGYLQRLGFNSTRDSLEEVVIYNHEPITFNKWYHLAAVCNNSFMALYVDGQLIEKQEKHFETKFLDTDSMMIGHTASLKNLRFLRGAVDDIRFYHRPLTDADVMALYNEQDPNEMQKTLKVVYRLSAVILCLVLLIVLLIFRYRRALKKQREELGLINRMSELELRAVKAQMNPHFVSNCLAAIQDLNYKKETEKAGLYIARFSLFLRQVLNYSDENMITAANEIEVINLFVELEQLRFKNGFCFDLSVHDNFDPDELLIPSLITQPFIENAIWHGLMPLKGQRAPHLTVRFMMQNGLPQIEIEDNGVGRDPNKKKNRKSKGTQLVLDKIDAFNRLSKSSNYKITLTDLRAVDGQAIGTKVIIQLAFVNE